MQLLWPLCKGQQALCPGQSPNSRRLSSCLLQRKREEEGHGRAWEHPWLVRGGGHGKGKEVGSWASTLLKRRADPRGGASELTRGKCRKQPGPKRELSTSESPLSSGSCQGRLSGLVYLTPLEFISAFGHTSLGHKQ